MKSGIGKFILLVLLVPSFLLADTAFFQDVSLNIKGYYRVRHYNIWNLEADKSGNYNNFGFFTHQLRIKPEFTINEYTKLYLDILGISGFYGNNPGNVLSMSTADTYPNIVVKRAYGKVLLPYGALLVGRMPSNFGLGIFSNDGDHPVEFGDTNPGNTYDRILFATKPMKNDTLTTAIFFDRVVEGQSLPELMPEISVETGDGSGNINDFGIYMKYQKDGLTGGFYFIYRTQSLTSTKLYIPDLCLKYQRGVLHAALEFAYISGQTKAFPVLIKGKYIDKPSLDIDSYGGVLRVGAKVKPLEDVYLEAGIASGDKAGSSAFDDLKYTRFSFDPNYKVGLLMFDFVNNYFTALKAQQTMAYLSQNAKALKAIQRYNGLSESYVDEYIQLVGMLTPTNGAVRNAFYIFPVIKAAPVKNLELKLGILGAWVPGKDYRVETRHAYVSNGVLEYGRGSNYGWEVDFGASFKYTKNAKLGLEMGYFMPGNIFEKADGSKPDNVYTIIPRLTIMF